MTDNYVYKPDAIDMILGKGIISNDNCNIQDVAVMLKVRYGIIAEAAWLPNVGKYVVMVRTIAYSPKDVEAKLGIRGKSQLAFDLIHIANLSRRYNDEDYYKVLRNAINIAELYLLKRIIFRDNEEIRSLINDVVLNERFAEVLDRLDNEDVFHGLTDRITDEINTNYVTGSILWELTEYIKDNGYDKGKENR